jgi:hypothetical protein
MRNNTGISIQLVPASVKRTIDGINQLERNFEKAIADVIFKIGVNIQREAKQNAPVDFGFLRASIYLDTRKTVILEKSGISTVGQNSGRRNTANTRIPDTGARSNKEGFNAIIGSNLNYARVQDVRTGYLSNAYAKWKPKVKPAIRKAMIHEIKRSIFR